MSAAWLGVDPGPSWTGVTLRLGQECLGHRVIANEGRDKREHGVTPAYLADLGDAIAEVFEHAVDEGLRPRIAVEGINTPRGHAKGGFAKPRDLIGLGIVFGWALGAYPMAVVVQPNSHGQGILASYPPALVTPEERRRGLFRQAGDSALIRHARSAWDVTLGAERLARWNPEAAPTS